MLQFRSRRLLLLAAPAVAALELLHPTWPDDAIFNSVAPVVGWWLVVHVLLLVLFPLVLWTLGLELPNSHAGVQTQARALLILAAVANAAFIALDGIGTGVLIIFGNADTAAALTAMWNSPLVIGFGDFAGGAFALALLLTATALYHESRTRLVVIALVITGLAFLASALPQASAALLVSRIAGLATGAAVVYRGGATHMPFALLVFAAVLPQHVGPPAALGMLLIGAALALRPS